MEEEETMPPFQHVWRVLGFGGAVAVIAYSTIIALASFTPASAYCDYNQRGQYYCTGGTTAGPVVPQIWTAIAYSKSTLRTATSWNAPTKGAAEKAALDLCGTVKSDCTIAISGANTCIAFAMSMN